MTMEFIQTIIDNVDTIAVTIAAAVAGGWAVFKLVAKFTKTTKDDEIVAKYDDDITRYTNKGE